MKRWRVDGDVERLLIRKLVPIEIAQWRVGWGKKGGERPSYWGLKYLLSEKEEVFDTFRIRDKIKSIYYYDLIEKTKYYKPNNTDMLEKYFTFEKAQ